jgi:hypothetical protein
MTMASAEEKTGQAAMSLAMFVCIASSLPENAKSVKK